MARSILIASPKPAGRVRVSTMEHAALLALAKFEGGLTESEVTRLALREACKARGLWPPKQHKRGKNENPG